MKLYETEPDTIRMDGRSYRYKAPFDTVLFALDVLRSGDMLTIDRERLCFRLFFGRRILRRDGKHKLLKALMNELQGEPKAPTGEPPSMSLTQDADLIRAAFLQQYGIDLDRERGRMSWRRFMLLLSALADETELVQVAQLRTRPIPSANEYNAQERMALIRAKQRVALRPETAGGAENFARQLNRLFDVMMAKAGEDK